MTTAALVATLLMAAPMVAAPTEGAPRAAMVRADTPQAGALLAAAPEVGVPQAGASQAGAPQTGAPQTGAPQTGARLAGAPMAGALGGGAPPAAVPLAGGAVLQGPATACRISDDRLTEVSGLTVTGSGYVVVNDGADEAAGRKIFFLNQRCKVVRTINFPSRPRDTEDLAQAADGTLLVADIGDNGSTRSTVALWRLAPDSSKPRIFRLSYPDGPHDAEALLLAPDGTPIIVTKDPVTAGLYVPDGPLRAGKTTPLRKAGSFAIPMTTTANPFGLAGHLVITGGAVSADGRRVVLRTYADAFAYPVPDGDLIRALTGGEPEVIALPDEPQGESVAFTADGTALLTASERPSGEAGPLLCYPLSAQAAPPPASPPPASPPPTSPPSSSAAAGPQVAANSSGGGVPVGAVIAGIALLGAVATLGIAMARRRRTR